MSTSIMSRVTFCAISLMGGSFSPFVLPNANLWAAEKNPQVKEAIEQGVVFLKKEISKSGVGYRSLAAYALLKAGEPADSKEITEAVEQVVKSVKGGKFTISSMHRHYYAGVGLMLLADIKGDKHQAEIKILANYLIEEQFENGSWGYYKNNEGDTSVVQYAILGLWAAERAGVKVPSEVWDKAAKWHTTHQANSGGFAYVPGVKTGEGNGSPTMNMGTAGTGSMLILRGMLYPNEPGWVEIYGSKKDQKKKNRFGLLKKIDTSKEAPNKKNKNRQTDFKPTTSSKTVNSSIKNGLRWMDNQFRPKVRSKFYMYYYYALERMTALAGVSKLADRDWFNVCAEEVIKMQAKDGSWDEESKKIAATSFAILFLTRSTAKLLGHPVGNLGSGLLTSGRGLPDDFGNVTMKNGKVETKKSKDPLAKLLADLEKPGSPLVDSLQTSVIEKIQIGDPEELIGQRKQLLKIVKNKNPEVRKVALWALGRTGNISDARVMVEALKNEDNVDVLIEARNALCYLSHKSNGFGISPNPFDGIPEDATQAQKDKAMAKWKAAAYKKWVKWYLKVRPYHEQNDFLELGNPR